jgi:hypothetical protein
MIEIGHSGDQTQPGMAMSEQMEKEAHDKVQPRPPTGERTMPVDTFALLSIVMAVLLMLSQGFVIVWLDLL